VKAFLLAAGKGTRLKPYTDTHPKCLIPIHGRPLLQIWLDLLARHGVSEVLINTHHHADQVEAFIAAQRLVTTMALHPFYEPHLLGSAGTVWQHRSWVADAADFIIAYADNLTNADLTQMIAAHRGFAAQGGLLTMGLIRAPDPRACGIATVDPTQRIVRFIEKPSQPESDLANGGIYIANRAIFDYFPDHPNDDAQVLDIGYHLLPRLVGKMFGTLIPGYLRDIGSPQAYTQALAEWPMQ
jgi:mannose-1-phosphate guanylyltransferase